MIYEQAKSALLEQGRTQTISFTDITIRGHAGKRLVYEIAPDPEGPAETRRCGEAHLFLVDDRLYVIDAAVPAGSGNAAAKRFLSSIHFL